MTDNLLKDKKEEIYENFETDDNKEEELKKKKAKSKLAKPLIIVIAFLLIFAGFIYFKYFHRSSNSLSLTLLEKYNELGKKDENLRLFVLTELFLDKRKLKYTNAEIILHFNKDDIDLNRLLRAIKIMVENQAVFQSIFYQKDGQYHIKFDKNLYPEIIQKTIKESEYNNCLDEIEKSIHFNLNELMYKIYIIQTEKSLYLMIFKQHCITDKMTSNAFFNTLNKAYLMNDTTTPFKSGDLYYASLYDYNLKLKDKKFVNYVKNYFSKNYDLGRTFKGYRIDKDIQYPLQDIVIGFGDISSKSLRDKIYSIFGGKVSKISMFNIICHLYTLYLYNNMEDHIPEIVYLRHGRNLKYYQDTMGCLLQNSFINYDILKNTIKKNGKNYLNVQKFYENVKKQFDEQKSIAGYVKAIENYDYINSLDNLAYCQMYQVHEIDEKTISTKFWPRYIFGKEVLEKTKASIIFNGDQSETHFIRLIFENVYSPSGIINHFGANADSYSIETLQKISKLFFKVADTLSDGFLAEDKLIEIKMLDY